MRFYFVIREIMVIFALEIERQLIIALDFLYSKVEFNLLLITNKIKTKKLKLSNMAKIVTLGEIMLRLSQKAMIVSFRVNHFASSLVVVRLT